MSVFHRTAGKAEALGHPAKLKSQKLAIHYLIFLDHSDVSSVVQNADDIDN